MDANAPAKDGNPLVVVDHVRQSYARSGAEDLLVLDDVSLRLGNNEIVSLLGRSGCGKSSLLRIIAGLVPPTRGRVTIGGRTVAGPAPEVALVFQTFALFPWLTVLENVEIGLEAQRVAPAERHKRALAAIDLIGLDGYESAYPKELSGGMRQRVGMARALVVHPKVLLMDEAFSALDVLTAENLRTDLLELWSEGRMPISSILLVTHNIEEAVLLCDRILVFSTNPGRVVTAIEVDLPRPRDRLDPTFREVVERIYVEMTARAPGAPPGAHRQEHFPGTGIGTILPQVSTNRLAGLLEAIAAPPYGGHADLPVIAHALHMQVDDLFPAAETLQMLRFVEITGGDIHLSEAGQRFAGAELDQRKRLFAHHLLTYVPLAAHVRRILDERFAHRAPKSRFRDELEDHMTPQAAEQTLRAVIGWGRYAEAFAYDDHTATFSLENPT